MKTTLLTIVVLIVAATTAVAQDACVYQYSFVNRLGDSFGFCLTAYGTLYSLQSPIGTEHLDPANLEGFMLNDVNGLTNLSVTPTYKDPPAPPKVTQHTPGKLPIVFTYATTPAKSTVTVSVTATPGDKTVTFTINVRKWVFQNNWGDGSLKRETGLLVDGLRTNTFATSGFTAFAYNPTGHGVVISGASNGMGNSEDSGEVIGNSVIEIGAFSTQFGSQAVVNYKVF